MALRCVWVVLSADSKQAKLACASGSSAVEIGMDVNLIASHIDVSSHSMKDSTLELTFSPGSSSFLRWLASNQPKVEVPADYKPIQAQILWPELPQPRPKGSAGGGCRIIRL